jgi:cytochrome P450
MLLQIAAGIIGLDGVDTEARTALLAGYQRALDQGFVVKWSTRDHAAVIREGLEAKRGFARDFLGPARARRQELVDAHRAGRLDRGDLPTDLLTLLLLHWDPSWDDDLPVREAIQYMAASIGTSTSALVSAVDELDGWLRDHPEDRAKLDNPRFLRRVSNETLRLRPTFPAMIRGALRDVTLASGRPVRRGERFVIPNDAINRDPAIFGPDADRFNPYRAVPPGVHDYGLAFGVGPKNCIGKGLVTTVPEAADGELQRMMVQVLRALHRHGIVVDRAAVPVRTATTGEQYDVFPVRFERL